MTAAIQATGSRTPSRLTEADCRVEDFAALVDQTTQLADYPHATEVQLNVVVYDSAVLRTMISTVEGRADGRGRAHPRPDRRAGRGRLHGRLRRSRGGRPGDRHVRGDHCRREGERRS